MTARSEGGRLKEPPGAGRRIKEAIMRVLLVSANTAVSPYPLYPLGLSMVAAALDSAGHEVRQFDFLEKELSLESLSSEIKAFGPELVGVSIRNIDNVNYLSEKRYIDTAVEIVANIKRKTSAKIVLGGAGFSLMPKEILEATGADYGIAGEGEGLMVDFIRDAANGVYPEERVLFSDRRLSGKGIPSALYDEGLMNFYLNSGNIASVQTKRGCAHSCVYCSYPLLEGRKIRGRDPGRVVDDIELLRDTHKVKYVFFIDSVLNDHAGLYLEILKEMIRRKVSVPWTAFFRPTGLDDETVEMMKQTGLVAAEIGADAATDKTLRQMGKGFTFKDVARCNELFLSHGIAAANFYIFCGPGETEETLREGIENIRSLDRSVHFIYLGVRVLPDTPLYRLSVKEGLISADRNLLEPVYYFSPNIDRQHADSVLSKEFSGSRLCIYPPDSMDDKLRYLHRMGYSGPMWELLLSARKALGKGAAVEQ